MSPPAVKSSRHDPHYLPDLLTYLTEPIVEAKHGGGSHGGTTELDGGATPVVTTETQITTRRSIYELR